MVEIHMVLDEYWPEYRTMTEEEYNDYCEYIDHKYKEEHDYQKGGVVTK